MADHKGGLAKKLAEVTAAIDWLPKEGTANVTQTQSFKYVPAEVVYSKVRAELAKRKIAQSVGINDIEHLPFTTSGGKPSMLTTIKGDLSFTDGETGEVISVPFVGTGADSQDRGAYKAITGGLRDALKANFLIPTGDDPEATAHEGEERAAATPKPASTGPKPPAAEKVEKPGLTQKQRGLFEASLTKRGIESPGQRKAFITFATGRMSSTQMTSSDLDKALAELEDADSQAVANALAVV